MQGYRERDRGILVSRIDDVDASLLVGNRPDSLNGKVIFSIKPDSDTQDPYPGIKSPTRERLIAFDSQILPQFEEDKMTYRGVIDATVANLNPPFTRHAFFNGTRKVILLPEEMDRGSIIPADVARAIYIVSAQVVADAKVNNSNTSSWIGAAKKVSNDLAGDSLVNYINDTSAEEKIVRFEAQVAAGSALNKEELRDMGRKIMDNVAQRALVMDSFSAADAEIPGFLETRLREVASLIFAKVSGDAVLEYSDPEDRKVALNRLDPRWNSDSPTGFVNRVIGLIVRYMEGHPEVRTLNDFPFYKVDQQALYEQQEKANNGKPPKKRGILLEAISRKPQ